MLVTVMCQWSFQLNFFLSYYLDATLPPNKQFKSLEALVSEKTLKGIEDMSFTDMTEIQYKTVMPLLAGRFVLCSNISLSQ